MARPGERMRLKDRIVDNISKTIKSIQELVYYQYKDPLLTGYDDSVVLYNGNRQCHKLCENLDHTLLHGLNNVMRGYWRVVKQLSPHAMVKEIDLLVNVTTDLGKGRAWLYASLNEGLLESYIRLLCDNDKLLKKYYAKEALVLDRDRMSVLLTLASGLDCVTFKLEYDLPYLDLNAFPPRSRSNSEQDGDASSDSSDSYLGHPSRYRSMSEVFSSSPLADCGSHLANDSDSASLASLDVCQMKVSTISADSGFPADSMSTNGTKQHCVLSVEAVMNAAHQNNTSVDNVSLSSLSSSSGDPDRHQRLENVSSSFGRNAEDAPLLEVIHMKGKKLHSGKSKRKKIERSGLDKSDTTKPTGSRSDFHSQKACDFHSQKACDFHSQKAYNISNKINVLICKGGSGRSLKTMANGSVLAGSGVVKNVSGDCRHREALLSSDATSYVSRTVLKQVPSSHVCKLIPPAGHLSAISKPPAGHSSVISKPPAGHSPTTGNLGAEVSGGISTLYPDAKGSTSSAPSCLLNSSNAVVIQNEGVLLGSACLTNNSKTALAQESPASGSACLSSNSNTALAQEESPASGSACLSSNSNTAVMQEESPSTGYACLSNNSNTAAVQEESHSSGSACLSNNSNTAAVQEESPSSGSACLSNNSNTAVMQDGSPFSELCGLSAADTICDPEASFENNSGSLFSLVIPDSSVIPVRDNQSFKHGSKISETPPSPLIPHEFGQTKNLSSIVNSAVNSVHSVGGDKSVVDQQSQPNVTCVQRHENGACFQSQPDVTCVQSQQNAAYVQSQQNGACVESQPDVTYAWSQPDVTCVQSQQNRASVQNQQDGPSVLSQPDVTYAWSQPDVTCIQHQENGACVQSQPNVTCVQSQPNVTCDQSKPNVMCDQNQPDVTYDQSQPNVICVQIQPNMTCVQIQPNVTCVQNQPNVTCVQSQKNGPCVQSQKNGPSVQSQPDVTRVQQDTNYSCDEQFKIQCGIDQNGNEDLGFSCPAEDDIDVYSSNKQYVLGESNSTPKSLEQPSEMSSVKTLTQLEDDVDCIHDTTDTSDAVDRASQVARTDDVDLSLRLDNNTVLQLMLDVFSQEDETLLKMFVMWENQTEGGTNVAFLLISDHCLYILHYHQSTKKFVRRSCTALMDIIFISVGLNGQTLNIESRGKNKQKQRLWLTPGNHCLSQAVVTCLSDAVKAAIEHSAGKSRFSVGSEVPLQKIALRKYIAKELSIKPQEVTLLDYSLVFWEDLSSANSSGHTGVYKEGRLDLRTPDPLKGHIWKPVYVVLKNNTLSVKNDASDLRPHCFLSLGGDQCVGCRLTSRAGRDNCVELVLAQEGSWLLSAASPADISEWRHSLCLAVSQGTVESDISSACIPCCAVVSNQHLFLCHEDLYSKFHRTLGRHRLEDVTMIAVDGTDPTYCFLKLKTHETGTPSRQWAFYFYSNQDLERHVSAIRAAWRDIHQTELPVLPMDDVAIQCSCHSYSNQLKRRLTLS